MYLCLNLCNNNKVFLVIRSHGSIGAKTSCVHSGARTIISKKGNSLLYIETNKHYLSNIDLRDRLGNLGNAVMHVLACYDVPLLTSFLISRD